MVDIFSQDAASLKAAERTDSDGASESQPSDYRRVPATHSADLAHDDQSLDSTVWVGWDGPDDPCNPVNWSRQRKWNITLLIASFTFLVSFTAGAWSSAVPQLKDQLDVSEEVAVLGLSVYALGFGVAPLLTAPLSEVYGRRPMYLISFAIYTILFIPVATAQNITAVIICRFLQGAAGSSGSTMVGGTLADMWITSERGVPMSIFAGSSFVSTGLGPATMGYLAMLQGWRWTIWFQLICSGVIGLLFIVVLRETRGSVILSKKAAKLRKETGLEKYKCKADEERASLAVLFRTSLTRPIWLLISEPIVGAFSLWVAFAWGLMYGVLEALPLVMTNVYGFNLGQSGLAFHSLVIGSLFGVVCNPIQERLYARNVQKRGPEARLYLSMVGGLCLPAGTLIFGFAQGRGHWMGPLVGMTITIFGVFQLYNAGFNYLADSYTIYASSAIAGQSCLRNVMGTAFPLFINQTYDTLGYTWAPFLFAMIGLVLAVVPFVLFARGPQLRARSKFAQALQEKEQGGTGVRCGACAEEGGGTPWDREGRTMKICR